MIRSELARLFRYEERHRRLIARLTLTSGISLIVLVLGTVSSWLAERGQPGSDIHGFGDAAFFTACNSSACPLLANPVTSTGKIIDVILEGWAVFVITTVAGSFATFFSSGDASSKKD